MIKSISKDGKHEIVFNEKAKNTRYKLDGRHMPGPSTFIKAGIGTSDGLINWKIRQATGWVYDNIQKGSVATKEDVVGQSVYAWKDKTEADVGTIVHDYAELKGKGYWEDAIMLLQKHQKHPNFKRLKRAIDKVDDWYKTNKDELLLSETVVGYVCKYHKEHPAGKDILQCRCFGGKFDRLGKRGDLVVITDYKTSKSFHVDQFIQDAAYSTAIEFWLGIKVDGVEVVRFGKEEDDKVVDSKLITDPMLLNTLKDQAFRCLDTYNAMKILNKEMKEV